MDIHENLSRAQAFRKDREVWARDEIERIRAQRKENASLLLWAVGPTLLTLPDLLPGFPDVTFEMDWGPTDHVLASDRCFRNLSSPQKTTLDLSDVHAQYEPFATLTAFWFDYHNHEPKKLRFGVLPFVELGKETEYHLALVDPTYFFAGFSIAPDDHGQIHLPFHLQEVGCRAISRTIDRYQTKTMFVLPTIHGITTGQYKKVQAAIERTLGFLFNRSYANTRDVHPDDRTMRRLPKEVLLDWVKQLHPPKKTSPSSPDFGRFLPFG